MRKASQVKESLARADFEIHTYSHGNKTTMPMIQDDGFEALLEPFYNGKKLTDPISTREDKYQLLPAFLKVKGESPASTLFATN